MYSSLSIISMGIRHMEEKTLAAEADQLQFLQFTVTATALTCSYSTFLKRCMTTTTTVNCQINTVLNSYPQI